MADTKRHLHLHAAGAATPVAHANGAATASTPSTPTLIPTPQLSPVPSRLSGRRMHTVLEELKNVTSRGKSPALSPNGMGHAPLPSPLNLNHVSSADTIDADGADASSPRLPASGSGKNKNCALCERSFTVFRAKHTCKVCQKKICDDCSKNRVKLHRRLERRKGSRLCDVCARDHISTAATPVLCAVDAAAPDLDAKDCGFMLDRSKNDTQAPSTTVSTTHAEGLRRATSSVLAAGGFCGEQSSTASTHLRSRHWASLAGVSCLLVVRFLRVSVLSSHGGDQLASGIIALLLSLTNWIDRLVSLRFIFTYVVGLLAYDEILGRNEKRKAPLPPPAAPKRLRTRTRSALSESARSTTTVATASVAVAAPVLREEEEVLEVEVGDKHSADAVGFTFDKMALALVDCTVKNRVDNNDMKMSCFLSTCDFVCGFILVFGKATAFAASTVTGYMSTIATNLAGWPIPATANSVAFSWKEQSVRAVIAREVELQVASTGGKKKPSCCRCILRLLWFIEFVEACVRYTLLENKEENCAPGASKAYEETIGARHPWIIRKGVNSALGSLPSRSAIIESLNLHQLPADEAMQQLRQVQQSMRAMITDATALLKEHNLMDIK